MPTTSLRQTRTLLIALLFAPTVTSAAIPPFCVALGVPPATCDAKAAQPCEGACPRDDSNSLRRWADYWQRCHGMQVPPSTLTGNQFMCRTDAPELHILYYNPAPAWVCRSRNPFLDVHDDGGSGSGDDDVP